MKNTLAAMLLSSTLALLPAVVRADEAAAKLQIETIAETLVPNLPSDKKVVLKTISSEDSGLPADFLRKLTSDLEAALLVASEFEIELVNRQTTEEIWAEAIEFNNANFEALQAASGADVALMLNARATEAGVEIALTAYSLDAADAGKVLASSGSTVLALDMQQNVGVDVNSLNDQMAQVLAEIEKVGQTGGLISDPNTYAEYYHNARILQQRGEVDLAIVNMQLAIEIGVRDGFTFFDPILDLADLLEAKYGEQNAVTFVEKKIVPTTNELVSDAFQLALRQGRDPKFIVERILKGEVLHPQILALWLRRHTDFYGATSTVAMDSARRIASLSLRDSLTSGEFFDAFIDDVSASAFVDQTPGARDPLPAAKNPIAYNITHQKVNETGQKVGAPILDRLLISDPISLQHNITICITGGSTSAECETVNLEWLHKNRAYIDGDIFRETTTPVWAPSIEVSSSSLFLNNTSKLSDDIDEWMDDMENLDLSANPLSAVGNHGDDFPFNWTLGIDCIESIAYVDAAGFAVRITPGKNVAFVLDREIDADQLAQISRCLQNQEAELIFPDMKK